MKRNKKYFKVKLLFANCNIPYTYITNSNYKLGRYFISHKGKKIPCELIESKRIYILTCDLNVLYKTVNKIDLIQKINGIFTYVKGISKKDLEVRLNG